MGLEHRHPWLAVLYFAAVLAGTVWFSGPYHLAISLVCALLCTLLQNGRLGAVLAGVTLPGALLYGWVYSQTHHFGVTPLWKNAVGNAMTLEAMVYGVVQGLTFAAVVLWLSCLVSVLTTDKLVGLLGRLCPKAAMMLAIGLRLLPRVGQQLRRMHTAQQGMGKSVLQGSLPQRLRNALRLFSMLLTWLSEAAIAQSDAARCRGSALRGRTAFLAYPFTVGDRAFFLFQVLFSTLTLMGFWLGETKAVYDPAISVSPLKPLSVLWLGGYALLCLLPPIQTLWRRFRFWQARRG